MTTHPANILEVRSPSSAELDLLRWLLQHGGPAAGAYLPELDGLTVVSRCACGCASVDFVHDPGAELEILSDHHWNDEQGNLFGVFVFGKRGKLAGLEVWSIDGRATPATLPRPDWLRPAESARGPAPAAGSA